MKSKRLTSVAVLMMSLIIMLGIFSLPASAATSISKATVSYEVYQTYTGKAIKPKVTVKVGKKKLTKDKDYTVSYSSNKSVGKGYITIKGKGSYTGSVKKGFYIQPKAVSSLKATAYSTKIKLSWSKATGAKGYQVYQYNSQSGKWVKLPTTSKTSCTVTGLDSVTTYKFRVRPYAKVGSKSLYGEWKTVSKSTTIGKPTEFSVSDVTESTATVQWNKIPGATSYRVYYINVSTGYSKTVDTATESVKLTKLNTGSSYKVNVSALNTAKKITGNKSDTFTFSTSPAAVKITKAEVTAEGFVNLTWSKVTGANGYTVYASKVGSDGKPGSFTQAGTVTTTTVSLTGLSPSTTYIFKVLAFINTPAGKSYSADSLTQALTTPEDNYMPQVQNFKQTEVTDSSVTFSWTRPQNIDGYKLYKNGSLVTTLTPSTTTYTFTGLTQGEKYDFSINTYRKELDASTSESEKVTVSVTTKAPATSTEVTGIVCSKPSSAMRPGQTYNITVTVLPENASDKTVTFHSSNTNVATVSQSGVITAKSEGTATITVKSQSNPDKTASFTLTVKTSDTLVTSISLPSEIIMYEGELKSLNPKIEPADATNKNYTVTGTDYTYSYKSGILSSTKTDTCKFDSYISVSTNNSLKAKKATIEPKTDKEFYFTVTVKTTDGSNKTATTKIKVLPKMLTVQYNGMEDNPWYYGNSAQLSVSFNSAIDSDYDDSDLRFKSSNTNVATVSNVGVVTCKGSGETVITAYTSDGKYSATYEIYVRGIVVIEQSYFQNCKPGQTYQIKAKIMPESSDDILMYYSLDTDIATVVAGGLVTFRKAGNVAIAVTTASDPYNYKQVWLTSNSYSAPSGSNSQLLSKMKTAADTSKNFTVMPTVMIKEKHIFENLKASTTTGTTADISSLESTIESVFPPTTTFLLANRATKQDFINSLPVKGKDYAIASSLAESDIKSISVKNNDTEYYYEMTMVLKDETLTSLPTNPESTRHGKVFETLTQSLYEDLKKKSGLDPTFDSLSIKYHDCSLTLRVNKITGNLENATYNLTADISVKGFKLSALIPALNASATYQNIITADFSGYDD